MFPFDMEPQLARSAVFKFEVLSNNAMIALLTFMLRNISKMLETSTLGRDNWLALWQTFRWRCGKTRDKPSCVRAVQGHSL